jgi:hypothetical protein
MGNGYLGKISAIVSANTADFDSKLSKSAAEVRKFAGSMQGTLTSAQTGAGNALRGIYTEAQKVERALQAVATRKLAFKGFQGANLPEAVKQMQAVFSVSQQISKPLAAAAKSLNGLSTEIQAEFLPAMISAQKATESLADVVDRTGAVGKRQWQSVTEQVEKTAAAIARLKEASTLTGGLATGKELRFQRPEQEAEIRRSAKTQADMASLPADAMSSMGSYVARQRAAADEVNRLAAAVEKAKLSRKGNTSQNVANAESAYQKALEHQRNLNTLVEKEVDARKSPGATGPNLPPGYGGSADAGLGRRVEDPARRLDVLKGSITSVKSVVDALPASLQNKFIPGLRDAEKEFKRLAGLGNATAQEIEAARQKVVRLARDAAQAGKQMDARAATARSFGESFGGRGIKGINLGLDQRALRGYEGELTALQAALGQTEQKARGPAVKAFSDLRRAIAAAMKAGTIQNPATMQNIQNLSDAAVNATSRAGGGSVKQIKQRMQRAGDIGRGGFDNFALAVNQGAFAIDDFLSATGGMDQKLRAVSNNITQLGFILGGTAGLVTALAAVIGGQLVVGFVKWWNEGRTTENQTKALNDALEKQKSLVEELASAFKSLGNEMVGNGFSKAAADNKKFADSLEEIRKKQEEARDQRLGQTSPEVQKERANQAALKEKLDKESDPRARLFIERDIRQSQDREKGAIERARANPVSKEELFPILSNAARNRVRDAEDQKRKGFDVDINASMRGAVKEDIGFLRQNNADGRNDGEIEALSALLERLEDPVHRALDKVARDIAAASRGPAKQIEQAQTEVAEAIKLGLPGARLFALELDKNNQALSKAYEELETASKETDVGKREGLVGSANARIAEVEKERERIRMGEQKFRYARTVDPQDKVEARQERARNNLGAAGLENGQIARRMREIEYKRESIRQDSELPGNNNAAAQAAFADQEAALNAEVAAIEATTLALKMFSTALDRASDEAKSNLNSAQQRFDEARRADINNSTPKTEEDLNAASFWLTQQREQSKEAETELSKLRDREEEIKRGPEFTRMQTIDEQLQSGTLSADDKGALRDERGELQRRVDIDIDDLRRKANKVVERSTREEEAAKSALRGKDLVTTPEEKFAQETENGLNDIKTNFAREFVQDAGLFMAKGGFERQDQATEKYKQEREKEARTATSAGRGREAFMTDRERFARDSREGIVRDMTAGAIDQAGLMNVNGRRDLLEKGLQNQMEQVAPGIAAFDEERKNAQIQGPSRAALNVTDVSTSQGASELTRLLRGDDSAKDVNLAELRKQTSKFDDLIQAVKDANPGVIP